MVCVGGALFLGGFSLGAAADDSPSGMIVEKRQIESLMADKDVKPVLTDTQWGERNPFDTRALTVLLPKPEKKKEKVKPHFVLQGIFLGSSKPSVIINGKVVGIGKNINGATLKEIKDSRVVLVDEEGHTIVLSLK